MYQVLADLILRFRFAILAVIAVVTLTATAIMPGLEFNFTP
ncbi:MAG: hypothetical protein ACNA8W_11970 [Bradymonadaceae bacterium]